MPQSEHYTISASDHIRIKALKGCHNGLGHLGIERTLDLLRDQFYWPRMTEDETRHIQHCERCL